MMFFFIPIILFISYKEKFEILIVVLFTITLLFILSLFIKKTKKIRMAILLSLILTILLILTTKDSIKTYSFETKGVVRISGIVSEDSSVAKFNQRRIKLKMYEINLRNGDAASSYGYITVYGLTQKLYKGDDITIIGVFNEDEFNAKTILLNKRTKLSKFRIKILEIIEKKLKQNKTHKTAILSNLLVLGYSDYEEFELKILSTESGSAFVLALSGLHLSLLYSLISFISFPFKKETKSPIILILLTLYVALIGNKASLIRAVVFRVIFLLFKKNKTSTILTLTLIIHIIISKESSINLSSIYSYSAICGILFISKAIERIKPRLNPIIHFLISTNLITLSAIAFTSHISLTTFSQIQLSILLTSTALTLLISIYLTLSLFSLFITIPNNIFLFFYEILKRVMIFGSNIKPITNPLIIIVPLFILLGIYLICMMVKDVEFKLR